MSTALVIGASRGIGHEFVRQLLDRGHRVIATARSESAIEALTQLGATAYPLDVLKIDEIAGLQRQLEGEPLDLTIVNAGIIGPRLNGTAAPDAAGFDELMHTNVLAPWHIAHVVAGPLSQSRGTLAFISSRMGSIGQTATAGSLPYRVSKAALNMVVKGAALELNNVRVFAVHPGWVKTDMGGQGADIDVKTSVSGMLNVLGSPQLKTGGFYDYRGEAIEW